MDTILFYSDGGHRDEATRRQVRSVAAQYSHRIGPRKRKQVKRTKAEEQDDDKYKSIASIPPAAADDVSAGHAAAAAGPQQAPSYFNHPPPPLAFVAQHPSHDAAAPDSRPPGAPGSRSLSNAAGQLRWQPHWQPVQFGPGPVDGSQRPASEGHPSHHIGPGPPPFQHPPQFPPQYPPQDPRQYPYPPPPAYQQQHQRPESARAPQTASFSHSDYAAPRPQSQSAASSTAIRLPEYSWTEYPRYSPYHNSSSSATSSPERRKPHDRPELPLPVPKRVGTPRSIPRNGEPPVSSPTLNGPDVFLRGRKNTPESERRLRGQERDVKSNENTLTPIGQAAQDVSRMHIAKAPARDLPTLAGRSPRSVKEERLGRQDSSLGHAPS